MKTIYALFTSALATVAITLMALILTACSNEPQLAADRRTKSQLSRRRWCIRSRRPADLTGKPSPIRKNPTDKPETFKIKGTESTFSLGRRNRGNRIRRSVFLDRPSPFWTMRMEFGDQCLHEAVTCHAVDAHEAVDESSFFLAENGRVWLYSAGRNARKQRRPHSAHLETQRRGTATVSSCSSKDRPTARQATKP
jgi:hypothetical protein